MESGLMDDYAKVLTDVVKRKFEFDLRKIDINKAADVVIKTVPMCFPRCCKKLCGWLPEGALYCCRYTPAHLRVP